eukprot:CFRG8306T1
MACELTSVAGTLALLDEPSPELQIHALNIINNVMDEFWAEVSEYVSKIEALCEDSSFSDRELAALVASKIYYHLGEFDSSLLYALSAGSRFDVDNKSQYVETIVSQCIDSYITSRQSADALSIDSRLESVVNYMFESCLSQGEIKQAIGIAFEARRIDVFERAVKHCDGNAINGTLEYSQKIALSLVLNREFRNTVLRTIVGLYNDQEKVNHIMVCQCYMFLDQFQEVANVLVKLMSGDDEALLTAYQVSFDVYESASQHFAQSACALLEEAAGKSEGNIKKRLTNASSILSGEVTIGLEVEFLFRNNQSDLLILNKTKDATTRISACHTATVIANSYMHAGTTIHQFLYDNLEWLGRATNWAKFTATASLGVIHRGHLKDSRNVLSRYLPKASGTGSPYSEGGSLFALGLIHANHGADVTEFLVGQLPQVETSDILNREILQHGACLGLGCAEMATGSEAVYDELKNVLYSDSAVAGEAAGLAMGMVMLGTANQSAIEDMINYAHETAHEKIIRGLALGLALIMYAREEEAEALIDQLSEDKDPILRFSAMYMIGMAYIGTGNNKALLRLLHFAVSDVNDDVRRAAVTSLGFLLYRTPRQCPAVVSLLSESYNPHVRYGAALALGFSCAGTGMKEAIGLLEPMINDAKDFVRQGALVAMAMVMVQQSEEQTSKATAVRKTFEKVITDKSEDTSAKFGAILAQGIIDAGGRNATISLDSRTGHTSMRTAAGLLLFAQFWNWYPMANFLSLAFTPTSLVLLNKDLKMPKCEIKSDTKASLFAYPPRTEVEKVEVKEKVSTAVLSITQKVKAKMRKDGKEPQSEPTPEPETKMEVDEPEPAVELPTEYQILENPARVVPAQRQYIQIEGSRYTPVRELAGIVMVRDTRPMEVEELVALTAPQSDAAKQADEEDKNEPEPPQPFDFESDLEN